jgi:hypothetical protein
MKDQKRLSEVHPHHRSSAASAPSLTIGYSWGWTNTGDAAIAPGLLKLLGRTFPDHAL